MGKCPCPRCLVSLADCDKIGQARDMENRVANPRSYIGETIVRAREFIFNLGKNVASAAVERILSARSWVPTLVSGFHYYIFRKIAHATRSEHICREAGLIGLRSIRDVGC